MKRSADRPPGFQCPLCISKAAYGDRNVPTRALPDDLHTQNQDHTTSLPPQEAQVADDTNHGSKVLTATQNGEKKNKNVYETFWHTPPRNAEKIDRIHEEICH